MVRPAARYRPAAKRFQNGVDPLWVVTSFFDFSAYLPSNDAVDRKIELYRGSVGKLMEYQPWAVANPPIVGTGDPGLLATLVNDYQANDYLVVDSYWSGQLRRVCLPMRIEVIDGIAYIALLRAAFTTGTASVTVRQNSIIGYLNPFTEQSALVGSAANYDILLSEINLETGQAVHTAAPLYQSTLNVNGIGGFFGATRDYQWTMSLNYGGVKEVMSSLLPSSHPFRGCSASALYGHLLDAWIPKGSSTVSTGVQKESTPNLSAFNDPRTFTLPRLFYDLFSGFYYDNYTASFYSNTLSLNTDSDQHIVSIARSAEQQPYFGASVSVVRLHELATLDDPGPASSALLYRQCEQYRYLGLPGPDSFTGYEPSVVQSAEEFLDITGLPLQDQQLVQSGLAASLPATVSLTRFSLGTTDPVIFSGYQPPLSFEAGKTSYLLFII